MTDKNQQSYTWQPPIMGEVALSVNATSVEEAIEVACHPSIPELQRDQLRWELNHTEPVIGEPFTITSD